MNAYIFLASGYVSMPRLDITINSVNDKDAIKQAKEMAVYLDRARYFSYSLYNIENEHKLVATMRSESVEAIVSVKEY